MSTTQRNRLIPWCSGILLMVLVGSVPARASAETPRGVTTNREYFTIRVLDRQTGRGVPLVELRTTNLIRHFTDSHGVVAFLEPGLMDREVFFFVESHGYDVPKDGFGYRGVRLKTTPGQEATVKIDRLNIAERLYRVTGEGIYHDSVLTGRPIPLKNPVLNGQVMGQDSVFTCLYRGRLFWMWGDTGKPSYPLGNFAMSGALSDLPARGGLDPAVGVDLEYFLDESGFSRKMAPLKEPGLVWLDGLMTVPDRQRNERMVAKFARLKSLGELLERGLMVFNDATNTFEPIVRPGLEFLPYRNTGHAFPVQVVGRPLRQAQGRLYYYFAAPSPMGPRLRVPAQWDDVVDANRYEVLTALAGQGHDAGTGDSAALAPRPSGHAPPARWVKFGEVLAAQGGGKTAVIKALEAEAKGVTVYDVESGRAIIPHNGTVYFNAWRHRWIGVFGQLYGESSAVGEIWYAEADTPVGPWAYARKIITHNKYSFYNPKHHPLFDQDGGRTIYLEGTYTWTFSGSEERATPRYDYNQMMYRLNLGDPRLILPAPVYQVRDEQGGTDYLMGDTVAQADRWDTVESVAFYAVAPDRADKQFVPVYVETPNPGARRLVLTLESRTSEKPLFCALPPGEATNANPCIVPLYEYRHTGSGQSLYSTEPQLSEKDWVRAEKPLCRVMKAPSAPLLLDGKARPTQPD